MRITIERKTFVELLEHVYPFASAKTHMAILKYGRVTTKDKAIKIESNDSQGGIVKYASLIESDADGQFLIPIADMLKFVSNLKCDSITLNVDNGKVDICHPKGIASFAAPDAIEFPAFESDGEEAVNINIPARYLIESVKYGKPFISDDTLRPQMAAIFFYATTTAIGFCASDTKALIHGEHEYSGVVDAGQIHFLVMPNVFSSILKCKKQDEMISISVTDAQVEYRFADTRILSRQARGKYPEFKRVIPSNDSSKVRCCVKKADVMDSLKRIISFVDNNARLLKMEFDMLTMNLIVTNYDDAKKSIEQISHNGCTGELTIGVNAQLLEKCFQIFDDGALSIQMTDASHAIVFRQYSKPGIVCLTMPLSLGDK